MVPRVDGAFRERVYQIVRLVPHGTVATYGLISTLTGMPRQARQVGWALHTLPAALVWGSERDPRRAPAPPSMGVNYPADEARLGRVPWHRVINAKGRVSTHPDEAGTYRQIELLRSEGIDVADDGALVRGLAAHLWEPDPSLVAGLELPAEVLFALDRQLDRD